MTSYAADKNQKILVVGTEPAVLLSLRTMLSMQALEVFATDEPDLAIRLTQTQETELALGLIDVCTTDMEPLALAENLCARQPGMKILFFSSLVDGEVIRLGIVDPESGVLRKEGVMRAIENALQGTPQLVERPRTLSASANSPFSLV
jgi:DNA-binding NtrC family response regulator